ncbi:NAD-dependent epimerase/dehydratase family protein [Xylophilus rhododendri]|uniref:NAD-dependent epimerase/dehydratase family protein n=1 Tax=Xylophilus rhododendri TaxID=2697032 RepID=A0A857J5S9_9BURK|nr:NAD(P)-dependent oxidoreductase [Xylophilus rhododendri]QHI98449.1 NAD-dependent epimerase/dehydratase family protein [Xylophilus rhododendri]
MKVLILGGSGHVGGRLFEVLDRFDGLQAWRASRQRGDAARRSLQLDTLDAAGLRRVLPDFDGVVNCVAGSPGAIAEGARLLTQEAGRSACRVVHLSSMAVYGHAEGVVREDSPLDPTLGWYAAAKVQAEGFVAELVARGGQAVILRPGCIAGPGSQLWVGRIGRWLRAGRLGDIGAAGDGWTNLVHVDDVCRAIATSLRMPLAPASPAVFNLASPDSPRWDEYFVDLGVAIGATPVRWLSARRVRLDAMCLGPPLKIAGELAGKLGIAPGRLPDAIPPSLVRHWGQQIRLDATAARAALGMQWTPYRSILEDSAAWVRSNREC